MTAPDSEINGDATLFRLFAVVLVVTDPAK